jgi:ferredoxin-NADP reductase
MIATGMVVVLGGCVSSGTYQAKEQESHQLGRSLEEMKSAYTELQVKCGKFESANSEQGEQLKKVAAELAILKQENEKLAAAARPDNLLKALAETLATLQVKVDQLKAENAKLKQELLMPQQLQPVAPPPRKALPEITVAPGAPAGGVKADQPGVSSPVPPAAAPAVKQ